MQNLLNEGPNLNWIAICEWIVEPGNAMCMMGLERVSPAILASNVI